jgi:hypothetical protein
MMVESMTEESQPTGRMHPSECRRRSPRMGTMKAFRVALRFYALAVLIPVACVALGTVVGLGAYWMEPERWVTREFVESLAYIAGVLALLPFAAGTVALLVAAIRCEAVGIEQGPGASLREGQREVDIKAMRVAWRLYGLSGLVLVACVLIGALFGLGLYWIEPGGWDTRVLI